jgi:CheY-like chemotaxis protein
MARLQVRCHTCGSRVDLQMSELEVREIHKNGYQFRPCRVCRGSTRHDFLSNLEDNSQVGLSVRELVEDKPLAGRVFVIDDDLDIRTVLAKTLTGAGYEVVTAESGRDAMSLLAREDFDAILSDVRMPELDGPSLFRFLEQHLPATKNRIIFVTGDSSNPDTMKFLGESGRPFLPKPVNLAQLLALVEAVIATAGGGSPAPSS